MRILRKLPVNIDYILAALMILAGAYITNSYVGMYIRSPELFVSSIFDILSYVLLIFDGIILAVLPHKNLRRTIWLCSLMLGIDLLIQGYNEYDTFSLFEEIFQPTIGDPIFTLTAEYLSFAMLHVGCGCALVINSAMFATRRVQSIYPIVIATIVAIVVDYAIIKAAVKLIGDFSWEYMKAYYSTYVPHMILLGIFTLVFTSDEVSWYTAKGDMLRALNRLKTANSVFDIYQLTRNQLILLMQCQTEYTIRLRREKYVSNLEVRHQDGKTTLVFTRSGVASMAGALYVDVVAVVLPDTLSKSRYVDIYGEGKFHIRMKITEPKKRFCKPKVLKDQLARGVVPLFRYSVTNACLYHLVDGEGESTLKKRFGKKTDRASSLKVAGTGEERTATVYDAEGNVMKSIPARAIVPVYEFGAYTKLYIYGDMGDYMAFKIALPKRGQAEGPDAE